MQKILYLLAVAPFFASLASAQEAVDVELEKSLSKISEISAEKKADILAPMNRNIYMSAETMSPQEVREFVRAYNQLGQRNNKDFKPARVNPNNKKDVRKFFEENFKNKVKFEAPE